MLGGVTAVCTVAHGYSDDGTLCGPDWGIQNTQGSGGGFQVAILGGHVEKVLRTFSLPVLYDDVIESPFLGYSALFSAAYEITSMKRPKTKVL